MQKQKVKLMQLRVAGSETVTVPAGTFDAFKVELSSADGGPDKSTVWIAKDTRDPGEDIHSLWPKWAAQRLPPNSYLRFLTRGGATPASRAGPSWPGPKTSSICTDLKAARPTAEFSDRQGASDCRQTTRFRFNAMSHKVLIPPVPS